MPEIPKDPKFKEHLLKVPRSRVGFRVKDWGSGFRIQGLGFRGLWYQPGDCFHDFVIFRDTCLTL